MRRLLDNVGKVRFLLGSRRRWRWLLLLGLALAVTVFEAIGAVLVYLLTALIATNDAQLSLPIVGDLIGFLPEAPIGRVRTWLAITIAVFFLVRFALIVARTYVQERVTNNAGVTLAGELLHGYLRMPYLEHTQRNSAELVRNTYDNTQVMVLHVLRPLVVMGAEVLLAAGLLVILLLLAPLPTLLAIGVFAPTIWLLQRRVQPALGRLGRQAQVARTGSLSAIQQSLGAIRDLKILGREDAFARRHTEERARLGRTQYLQMTLAEVPRTLIETALVITIVVVFVVSTNIGTSTEELFATLGLFAYVGLRLHPSLQKIIGSANLLRFGAPILDDLAADRASLSANREPGSGEVDLDNGRHFHDRIEVKTIGFRYQVDGEEVLRDINLTIERGRFVGVCGPTGGGKSTLIDLIVGLLAPTEGTISVDGEVLRGEPRWWWSQLGLVSQQAYLTDDTLRANIALGEDHDAINEERLTRCVDIAQLHDVVEGLDHGIDTVVGERGVKLSGGQRQRVAIARALYRDPPVVVLDEGTSALDTATERALVAALETMRSERTIIAVAHRISTLRDADEILVIADGRIAAQGSYDELLSASELFRSLAR